MFFYETKTTFAYSTVYCNGISRWTNIYHLVSEGNEATKQRRAKNYGTSCTRVYEKMFELFNQNDIHSPTVIIEFTAQELFAESI